MIEKLRAKLLKVNLLSLVGNCRYLSLSKDGGANSLKVASD